jgi:predicted enzyme related to lactoylglutathione lyase
VAQPVVHFEIAGKDAEKTQRFYASLFDWEVDTATMGSFYGMVRGADGGIGGGLMAAPSGKPYVTIYVQVDDLDAYLARAEKLGGKTAIKPTDIPGSGAFAMIQDPDGNMVGIYRG